MSRLRAKFFLVMLVPQARGELPSGLGAGLYWVDRVWGGVGEELVEDEAM